jgi:hypothetical protein
VSIKSKRLFFFSSSRSSSAYSTANLKQFFPILGKKLSDNAPAYSRQVNKTICEKVHLSIGAKSVYIDKHLTFTKKRAPLAAGLNAI